MKNARFFLIAVLMTVSLVSFGQLAVGIKGGLNFNASTINLASGVSSASDVAHNSTGFHFGVYAVAKLGSIGIQPELYYSVQGMDISTASVKGAITSNYVQIPILLRLNILKILNFHVGPQFGLVLKNEFKDIASGNTQSLKDAAKGADISLAAGVGLDLPMGLSASVRYIYGLSDLAKSIDATNIQRIGFDSWKNSIFQLSIGYTLIGK